MLIAVNVQSLVKDHLEGLGWFTYESLKRIVQQHPEHQFLFIFAKGIEQEFIFSDNVKAINIWPPYYRVPALYLKFEWILPFILRKYNIDLFISTDGISSTKLKVKNLDVIHDLNFEENPQWLPKSFANYYQKYFPKWAKNADRIATVSEYSKQDIHKRYGIALDKIDVVYNGSNDLYQAISEEEKEETKKKYSNDSEYFVFVGSLHPRKNIDKLLLGFEHFKNSDKNNTKLVVVGSRFYWSGPIKEAFDSMKYQDDVIFTGHIPTEDLKNIVSSSIALAYVSLFEGFGIPLVEAMNAETAIIASNTTCLPEIAGESALYVNPNSISEIGEAMLNLSTNPKLREDLVTKGRIQREKFSWQQTADKLWATIEKTIKS